jgi:excisionase family DNA binding protein
MPNDTDVICVGPERAAELLGVGRSTLFELIADGFLPTVKIGRRTLLRVEALRGFAAGREDFAEPRAS